MSVPRLLAAAGLVVATVGASWAPMVVAETKGLLFINKPAGLSFHRSPDGSDPGVLPMLRAAQVRGDLAVDGRLYAVHRLDRVTSGLLMVAKSAEAASQVSSLLRQHSIHKYYVALSGRKPSKKQGRVSGDMARSRRGSYKLLRTSDNPAVTAFISSHYDARDGGETDLEANVQIRARRAFLLKPLTGRTHQLRVALKCLGSPILGDGMYAAVADASLETRAYLHAAALRIPAGCSALSDGGHAIEVICAPTEGHAFLTEAFSRIWTSWMPPNAIGHEDAWLEGTAVASRLLRPL